MVASTTRREGDRHMRPGDDDSPIAAAGRGRGRGGRGRGGRGGQGRGQTTTPRAPRAPRVPRAVPVLPPSIHQPTQVIKYVRVLLRLMRYIHPDNEYADDHVFTE